MNPTAIGAVQPRTRVSVCGVVVAVRNSTRPWVRTEADLQDGTGTITLRFVGRALVPGIATGARLLAHGTAASDRGALVILNPVYSFVTEG